MRLVTQSTHQNYNETMRLKCKIKSLTRIREVAMHHAHLRIMPASRIAPTKHKINQCSPFHRYESFWQDSQNRHNPLPIFPPHLFCQLDACDQVAGTARAEEESVVLYQVARHGYRFCIGNTRGLDKNCSFVK